MSLRALSGLVNGSCLSKWRVLAHHLDNSLQPVYRLACTEDPLSDFDPCALQAEG